MNMNRLAKVSIIILFLPLHLTVRAGELRIESPDKNIIVRIENSDRISWSAIYKGRTIVDESGLGFEFRGEEPMSGNFLITDHAYKTIDEKWTPVVRSKHSEIVDNYNELHLVLREKSGSLRQMELFFRAYNEGIAFQYKLFRGSFIGNREITRELTTFAIPGDPKAWVVEYGGYHSSNEAEFFEHPLSYISEKTIAGMPLLMEYDNNCWVAITEAKIRNYAALYLGTDGKTNRLVTKLVPLPGEPETGAKVRFDDEVTTPWRVIMIGDNPGTLIESEIIQNLNDPCALSDISWIKPGLCAWDHWWSGEVKMEMPVIKQYIDLASTMGWPYMLVDWQWYGKFNTPEADITIWAPQINIPEIVSYAAAKNVRIILWLYSSDVNRNCAFKDAFPLYRKWGIAGVKIDFMDRDDQYMVNWYHDIIKYAAENQLLVDFHGAYKPDGIIRTYPNMITREGVMGNEYYKFSDKMSPEHNVKLAFTRMLAGQMDYTPGAFLNVTREEFKNQTPAVVWNTRAAELSKFIIYESPLTVVCDHPENILNKPGADFLRIVPTVWDDIKFLGGYPADHVAIARRDGNKWFVGILNNSKAKTIDLDLGFLQIGEYTMNSWADSKKSDRYPSEVLAYSKKVKSGQIVKIDLAKNGGFAAVIYPK
jgi:alpha-glucosidase